MPSAAKVRWAQFRVAVMAMAALSILAVVVSLLAGSDALESKIYLRTYLRDSTGVKKSTPVRLNGILVGKVDKVTLSRIPDPQKVVETWFFVRKRYLRQIPLDSTVEVTAENLLGDKYLEITKGRSPTPVEAGGELNSPQTVDVLQRADLIGSLQDTLERVDTILAEIETGKSPFGKFFQEEDFYRETTASIGRLHDGIAAVSRTEQRFGRLLKEDAPHEEIVERFRRLSDRLADIQSSAYLRDSALYNDAHKKIAELRTKLEDINAGRGAAGKLFKSDELYIRISREIDRLDNAVDALNSGQLLPSANLYEWLDGATRDLESTLSELRANPRKFLRVKLGLF